MAYVVGTRTDVMLDIPDEKVEGYDAVEMVRQTFGEPQTWEQAQNQINAAGFLIGVQRQRGYGPGNINGDEEKYISVSDLKAMREEGFDEWSFYHRVMDRIEDLESDDLPLPDKILNVMVRCRLDKENRIKTFCEVAKAGGTLPLRDIFDAALDAMNYWSFVCRLLLTVESGPQQGQSWWLLPLESE